MCSLGVTGRAQPRGGPAWEPRPSAGSQEPLGSSARCHSRGNFQSCGLRLTLARQASERRPGGSGRQGRVGAGGWAAGTPGAWLSHDSGVPAFLEHRGPPGHSAYGPRPHPLPVCPGTNKGCPDRLPEQQADPQPRPIVCPGKAASVSTWALPAWLPALTA